jgi:hypothetical protein
MNSRRDWWSDGDVMYMGRGGREDGRERRGEYQNMREEVHARKRRRPAAPPARLP